MLFPNKSHRKLVKLPHKSCALSEFIGLLLGDGGYNNPWQFVITLNSRSDREYSNYVANLVKYLFDLEAKLIERKESNTLRLVCSSITVVQFLERIGGLVTGDKIKHNIDIPSWIIGNKDYERSVVRGLVDTDGCFYTHRHRVSHVYYHNLGFCFTSFSKNLLNSVADILVSNGIYPHFGNKGRSIFIYNTNDHLLYLEKFGTSNPRILNKFHILERCPSGRRSRPGKSVYP